MAKTPVSDTPLAHSIDEVARLANCGRTTIYAAINARALTARKIGRRTVILNADLQHWLTSLPAREVA